MSLRVQFWGTRGSIPSPGAQTVRYGGNTPCIEIRTPDDWLIVLDAGTGIRELGRSLVDQAQGASIEGDIFLSHAHWDHIQGLPFFAPMFQRGNHFTIWGSPAMQTSIGRVVRDQMSPVVFPVTFEELAATIEFRELGDGTGGRVAPRRDYEVSTFALRHPGGALGYRFAPRGGADHTAGSAFVYISDNELNPCAPYDVAPTWRQDLVQFVAGARVLVHDSMFTAEEYAHHRGWGHSTYEDAVDVAVEAGVETLVLFHHKPERTDAEVDQWTETCRVLVAERAKCRGAAPPEVIAAAEGLTLTV